MTPEEAEEFGNYVRARRNAHNLSTRALAGLAELDMATVVRIEQGRFLSPSPDKLRRIAKVLDIPVHLFLSKARLLNADDLPTPKPYLRAKYPGLPPDAVEEAERYLVNLMREHGVTEVGPAPGEDEK